MNIGYLLYREDIYSPLVEGQVINILKRVAASGDTVHFIWLKRIDYCFRRQDRIARVRKTLDENHIFLHEIPIIVGKFPLNKGMMDFVYCQAAPALRKLLAKHKIDILHTRGYNAGLLAARLLKNNRTVRHLFDPRSPYLTELVSTYGVKEGDRFYRFWKENETKIVKSADASVAISDAFAVYLKQTGGNIVIIPNNSEMEEPDTVVSRAEKQKRRSICFVGSLGYGWNNVLEYISFMKKVWNSCPDILLELYVLKQNIVREELKNAGIPEEKCLIRTLPQSEVGKTISGCMAGLQIMSQPDARLGIKTVDYLAAGVPVICNSNAMGAAQLIEQYGVGWNVDKCGLDDILKECLENRIPASECAALAYRQFSTAAVADRYRQLYSELLSRGRTVNRDGR